MDSRIEYSDDELQVESINNGGGDRISDLCDTILHQIFSFLPTRDVVQTCVLSKRWRNLWCSIPWLDFDEEAFLVPSSSSSSSSSSSRRTDQLHATAAGSSFSTFVNYALLLRDGSNIQKLRLSCSCSDNTSSLNHVFQYYIVAALKHNLQFLDLKILHHHHPAAENVLPSSLFTSESLTCMKLNNVVLLPSCYSSNICMSSLKTLHLISVKFPSNRLWTESLFSNSRNLETLTIHNFNSEQSFNISARQLKNLIIIQDDVAPPSSTSSSSKPTLTPTGIGISAPNLTSLKLHVDLRLSWCIFKNLKSLVEADIHLKYDKYPSSKYLLFMLGIFCELQNAKAITLSGSCLELIGKELLSSPLETAKLIGKELLSSPPETIISRFANIMRMRFFNSKENPFPNLKLMKLKTWFKDEEVHAITNLLKRSPNIETLVIEYNSESSYEEKELPLREEKLPSECTLHHLKTIQMRGFRGRKNEVKLLTFLLENAKSLKKMTVEEASIVEEASHSKLKNAKPVTFSGSCLQLIRKGLILSVETMKARFQKLRSKETPFPNLKLMNLKTWFENGELHGITDLLKRSPNIETLVIENNSESSYQENELLLREEKLPSECTLHHLKTIQMHGFRGWKNEVKLLTFLLEHAKSLKKMTVEEASI